ncbi:TPA: AraC family transcriptional regulator, partial [Clostridioides difficile]
MFINSGIIHSTRCIYQNTSILLQVPLSFLNKYIPDFKNCYFDFKVNANDNNYKKNSSKVKLILENMREIKLSSPPAANLLFTSLLFELLFELYTNFKISVGNKNMKKTV